MMQQWYQAKNKYKDAILLFRMGDFYELFGDDAIAAAPILELNLTSRDKDKSGLKMAGFPFHAAEGYIAKLVDHGHKVAICEQLEDPKASKGIVKRGVTDVLTPSTYIDDNNSTGSHGQYLLGISSAGNQSAICALDLGTAKFLVTSSVSKQKIIDEIMRLAPKEIVIDRDDDAQELAKLFSIEKHKTDLDLKTNLLDKPYLNDIEKKAALIVLSYLKSLRGKIPVHIDSPKKYSIEKKMLMDVATIKNLDLFPKSKGDKNNLISVLDETKTSMGKRALFNSINAPSTLMEDILTRQCLVEEFVGNSYLRQEVRDSLSLCFDIEKLSALVATNKIGPKKMVSLRRSLDCVARLKELSLNKGDALNKLALKIPDLTKVHTLLNDALADEPPVNLKDGGAIRAGFDSELDDLRDLVLNGKEMLLSLESRERQKTQIPSLKVKYTRVFGYYIEVTKTHLDKVPAHYQRKQTIANGERFITSELSDLEIKLNNAELNARIIEEEQYGKILATISLESKKLIEAGQIIAEFDLSSCLAELSVTRSYVKPKLLDGHERCLSITEGRHPIIEEICARNGTFFVPNDTSLSGEKSLVKLITGPNMAGKSTIMRQAALIQIMAQMGSFVPAKSASLSICDAIFARVGASDDLSTGRSTFMVEMSETASILNNATSESLILLDEIGRGTSTYDGLSIAQAVAEYIHDNLKARTFFATHYHELTKLEASHSRVKNYHVEIDEQGKEIRFLYTLKKGACLKSFGIEVARLSGLPQKVLSRATSILNTLEQEPVLVEKKPKLSQLDLFGLMSNEQSLTKGQKKLKRLLSTDINKLTPIQALTNLAELQETLKEELL